MPSIKFVTLQHTCDVSAVLLTHHHLPLLRRKRARTARGRTVVRPRWPGEDATPSGSREDSDGGLSSADEASQPWPGERLAHVFKQAARRTGPTLQQGSHRTALQGKELIGRRKSNLSYQGVSTCPY